MNGAKFNNPVETHLPAQQSLLETIRTQKRLIISVTLIVGLLTSAYSMFVYAPQYSSSGSVMIKDSALTAKFLTNDHYSTTTSQTTNPVLNTIELLKSDLIAEGIWQDVLVKYPDEQKRIKATDLASWKRRFGDGKKFIKSKNVPGTDVIYLNFQWPTPQVAQEGLRSVLTSFQLASLQQNQMEHRQRYIYLSNQSNELRTQLARLRENIATYKKTNNIYDLNSAIANYERARSDIDNSSKVASAEAQNYRHQLSAYESSIGMSPEKAVSAVAVGRSTTLSQLYSNLYALTAEKNSYKSRYTEQHAKMKQLDSQIAQLKQNINAEIARSGISTESANGTEAGEAPKLAIIADETRSNAVREMLEVQAKFRGSQAQSQGLRRALSDLDAKMEKIPQAEATLANLRQDEDALSKSLQVLDEKVLEAKMREAQTLSNVFILVKPSLPVAPLFPSRVQMMVLGVVFGLVGGIALAHGRQLMRQSQNKPVLATHHVPLETLLSVEQQKAEIEKEVTLINR